MNGLPQCYQTTTNPQIRVGINPGRLIHNGLQERFKFYSLEIKSKFWRFSNSVLDGDLVKQDSLSNVGDTTRTETTNPWYGRGKLYLRVETRYRGHCYESLLLYFSCDTSSV